MKPVSPMKARTSAALAALALSVCVPAHAAVLTDWNFGTVAINSSDNTPTPTTDITHTSSASIIGMDGGPEGDITNESGAPGNTDVWRVRGTANNGWDSAAAQYTQGVQFNVSTAGQSNISLSFNMAASNNGIEGLEVEYTTNGTTWNNDQEITLGTAYTSYVVSLSGVPSASNDPNFGIRLVSAYTGGSQYETPTGNTAYVNGQGNWRISDVQIDATPVPIPASLPLLLSGLGAICLMLQRSARRLDSPLLRKNASAPC
jgi:hypothetical protein